MSFKKKSLSFFIYFLYLYFGGKATNPDSCKPAFFFFGILTLEVIQMTNRLTKCFVD